MYLIGTIPCFQQQTLKPFTAICFYWSSVDDLKLTTWPPRAISPSGQVGVTGVQLIALSGQVGVTGVQPIALSGHVGVTGVQLVALSGQVGVTGVQLITLWSGNNT